MTAATCPPPPMTNALRRSITTWRLRRSRRARTGTGDRTVVLRLPALAAPAPLRP
ncbi:hypothetical protein HCB39_30050 [Salinispora arenicola]|nr:hypothetical protein [Salinispora arenicola]